MEQPGVEPMTLRSLFWQTYY